MGFEDPNDNRVFWLFHLCCSIVLQPYCPSSTAGHLLTTRKPPPTADSPISELGDDLLVAILIRLPNARSAFQCRSVCKRWSSLICSPHLGPSFVSRQQSRNQGGGDQGELTPLTSRDTRSILSFLPVPDEIRSDFVVLDSFKELILCGFDCSNGNGRRNGEMGRLFFVCNPFTRQWVALPLAPKRSVGDHTFSHCLVCEPHNNDDNGPPEYRRFRVVLVSSSLARPKPKVDLFCSESGEWMEDAMYISPTSGVGSRNGSVHVLGEMMALWDGNLCWPSKNMEVGMWNPFCPHTPPTPIDVPLRRPKIWVSLGALHMVSVRAKPYGVVTIWRWEEDSRTWTELYSGFWRGFRINREEFVEDLEPRGVVGLHPGKPEIVFLECRRSSSDPGSASVVFSCNLKAYELEFLAERRNWRELFQPRFTRWPAPIPGYEKLRGMYDGRYSCLLQSSCESSTPPTITGWQAHGWMDVWISYLIMAAGCI